MKLIEKILVPTDLSRGTDSAMLIAGGIAGNFGSEIIVLHDTPDTEAALHDVKMLKKKFFGSAYDMQNTIIEKNVKIMHKSDMSSEEVIETADTNEVNIIMLGNFNTAGDNQNWLGSRVKKVIKNTNKPVWLVKEGACDRINRILCSVDLTAASQRALEDALVLSRSLQAELSVLTVIASTATAIVKPGKRNDSSDEGHEKRMRVEFENFLKKFNFHNVKYKTVIRRGKPHEEIVVAATETGADLIIIGDTNPSKVSGPFFESFAEKVIRNATCSVLIIKSERAIRLKQENEIDDIEEQFRQGHQLLQHEFAEEAIYQFKQCIIKDHKFYSAWEGLALVYERLGYKDDAKAYRQTAKDISQEIWSRKVEAEIRSRHSLFGKKIKSF